MDYATCYAQGENWFIISWSTVLVYLYSIEYDKFWYHKTLLFVIWFLFCNLYYIQSQNLRNPRCMWMGVKYYHLILIHWTFHVLFTCHGLVYANYLRCHLFMRLKSTMGWYIFSAHLFYIHSFIWNPIFLITQLHNHLHFTFVLQYSSHISDYILLYVYRSCLWNL